MHWTTDYVGQIGSRRRLAFIKEELARRGFPADALRHRLYGPIGLDIGAVPTAEQKLAIYRAWKQLNAIVLDPTSDGLFGIPANVWASFVAIALGIALFVIQTIRHPEPETSIFRDGVGPVKGGAAVEEPAAETSSDKV